MAPRRLGPASSPPQPTNFDDDPTLVGDATKVMTPPPPPSQDPGALKRKRDAEPTQIVTPLPPPELLESLRSEEPRNSAKIIDVASSGGQTSGELVASRAKRRHATALSELARQKRLVMGALGAVIFVGIFVAAIGFSGPSPGPGAAIRGAASSGGAPARSERPVVVEPLPPPPAAARAPQAKTVEVAVEEPAEPAAEPAEPAAEPAGETSKRTRVAPSRNERTPARPSRPRPRGKTLTYDPDALFLKRP